MQLLLWHFCAGEEAAARLLRGRMQAAIESRIEEAIAIAGQLPGSACTGLLRSAPGHIVRAMAGAAR